MERETVSEVAHDVVLGYVIGVSCGVCKGRRRWMGTYAIGPETDDEGYTSVTAGAMLVTFRQLYFQEYLQNKDRDGGF